MHELSKWLFQLQSTKLFSSSHSSRLFFCCEMKASCLSIQKPAAVCPSVSNCLSSVCLRRSVCQLLGWLTAKWWTGDRGKMLTLEGIDLLLRCPICWELQDVYYYARKREQRVHTERKMPHGCRRNPINGPTHTHTAHTNIACLSGCHWCMNIQLHKQIKSRRADAQIWHEHRQTFPVYWTC